MITRLPSPRVLADRAFTVLLVDDDVDLLAALSEVLLQHWYGVTVLGATSGQQAMALFGRHRPQLVVLDLSIPEPAGLEVLRHIRQTSDTPVVLLTGRSGEIDQVRGLELGADGYVTKPFNAALLLSRLGAVLRRAGVSVPGNAPADVVMGPLVVEAARPRGWFAGVGLNLTAAEHRLLYHLARNAGRFQGQAALFHGVWRGEDGASANSLKALASRLRAKLRRASAPALIQSSRGAGYRLVMIEPAESARAGSADPRTPAPRWVEPARSAG